MMKATEDAYFICPKGFDSMKKWLRRAAAILFFLLLPSCLILYGLFWRGQIPDLPRGVRREVVTTLGDYTVSRYLTAENEEFYDLTIGQGSRTRVLVDRLTAYRRQNNKLYIRGLTGEAVVSESSCFLSNNSGFSGYGGAQKAVTRLQTARAFPPEDFAVIETMPEELAAYPNPNPVEFSLGSGRFRIEQIDGHLVLVDALSREFHRGYTIRLFTNVNSYLVRGDILYVRASRGCAVLNLADENYRVYFDDYGIKSYYSAYHDIEPLRSLTQFSKEEQKILKALPLQNAV